MEDSGINIYFQGARNTALVRRMLQDFKTTTNRPRSIYKYSNVAPRLSGQTPLFGGVFFVSKTLLGLEGQEKHEKFVILTRKPQNHARILIYQTWPIDVRAQTVFIEVVIPLSPSPVSLHAPS